MKIFILISIILALLVISSRGQIEQECWHGGKLENGKCQCFPGYYGDYCERFNCSNQAKDCGISLTTDLCSVPDIKEYCPGMCKKATCNCGFDKCFNNGTFNENDCKCNCTTGFIGELCENKEKCNVTECKNSGKFNSETCQCDCFANYKGEKCEILDCTINDPASCISYTIDDCFLNEIENYCPKLCKKCIDIVTETTKLTTTINKCEKKCVNGGQLTENCTCECYPNYSGEQCEKIDCSLKDPQKCLEYSIDLCYNNEIKNYCPKLCKQCDDKTTTQKLTTSTQKSATTTEKCEKKCENGGLINSNCSCECYPNYQGEECETLNCDLEEPKNCLEYTIDFCFTEEVKNYCPKLCRKCGTTSVSSNTTSNKETTILSTEILSSTESTNASPKTETFNFSKETITTFEDNTTSDESTFLSTEYPSSTENKTTYSYPISSAGDTTSSEESTILSTDFSSSSEYKTTYSDPITSAGDTTFSEESTILSTDFSSSSEYQTTSSDPITSSGDTTPSEESTVLSTDLSSSSEYQTTYSDPITSAGDTTSSEESTILSTDFSSSSEYQTTSSFPISSAGDTSSSEESTILSTDFSSSSDYQTTSSDPITSSGDTSPSEESTILSTDFSSSSDYQTTSSDPITSSGDTSPSEESTILSTDFSSSSEYQTTSSDPISFSEDTIPSEESTIFSTDFFSSSDYQTTSSHSTSFSGDTTPSEESTILSTDLSSSSEYQISSTGAFITSGDNTSAKISTIISTEIHSSTETTIIFPETVITSEDITSTKVSTIISTDSLSSSKYTTNLCTQIFCQNNGVFDPASCKCSCISGYSGNDCSIGPDCGSLPSDPDICSKDFCLDTDLKALCPKTCNCQKSPILSTISTITTILNSDTIFSKESTQLLTESSSLTVSSSISPEIVSTSADTTNINVPTILLSETDSISDSTKTSFDKTTVSQNLCTQIFCQNNGVFDPASCKCSCISGYSGNDCSIGPDCGSLPNDPDICSKDFCLDTDLKALCPKTCNCQKSPILSTISPEPCIQVQCKNNGLFDPASCKCSCISGYSGNDCSFGPDCETLQDDPEICSQDFCPDNDLKVLCPKTCNCTP